MTSFIFVLLELFVLKNLDFKQVNQKAPIAKWISIQAVLVLAIILFGVSEGSQFIYFQF